MHIMFFSENIMSLLEILCPPNPKHCGVHFLRTFYVITVQLSEPENLTWIQYCYPIHSSHSNFVSCLSNVRYGYILPQIGIRSKSMHYV